MSRRANLSLRELKREAMCFLRVCFLLLFSVELVAQSTASFTASGNFTWTAPACVNSINVQVWGAGGAGGGEPSSFISPPQAGGGGGGGAYLGGNSIAVVPGATYSITVGRGGVGDANDGEDGQASTATFGGTTITANGGKGGKTGSNGAGGAGGAASPGGFAGGTGAVGVNSGIILAEGFGGGGGGGAGTSANGANGQASAVPGAGGAGNTNGSGGRGGDPTFINALFQTSGAPGESYGGGGGGANSALIAVSGLVGVAHGGNGADGAVIISYTAGTTPSMTSANTATVCSGTALTFSLTASQASTFSWIASDNTNTTGESTSTQNTSVITDNITNNTTTAQTVTYTVIPTATVGGCVGTPQVVSITVYPIPVLSSTLTPTDVCTGNTFTYNATSTTVGASFSWSRATVAGITEAGTSNNGDVSETLTNTTSLPIKVTYTYTTSVNGCSGTPQNVEVNVNAGTSMTLTSAPTTSNQNVCRITPMTDITYTVIGASGATITGLPAGISGSYNSGLVTISGTPTVEGAFGYTVAVTGGCSSFSSTGKITIGDTLTSAVGTDSQNVCINEPIVSITYAVAGTGAVVTGLPNGVTDIFTPGVLTISGTPTVAGAWHYTVTPVGACSADVATGVITVGLGLITNGLDTQSVCKNSPIQDIQFTVVGGDSPAPTVNGLPAGVTSSITAPGILTISGTPTIEGLYNYTVITNGTCAQQSSLMGSISVGMQLMSAPNTDTQSVCKSSSIIDIVYGFGGGDVPPPIITGLPTGVTGSITSPGVYTISGSPTEEGIFNYLLTTNGSCASQSSLGGRITVGLGLLSSGNDTQSVCKNEPITDIVFTVFGGDTPAPTVTGLPNGIAGSITAPGVFTITGASTVEGRFYFTVTSGGSCSIKSNLSGMITVGIGLVNPGTDNQSVCKGDAITDIKYAIVGGDIPPPTVTGLPAGVSGTITAPGEYTISGTPTAEGLFTYTISTNGTCSQQSTLTGSITVGMKLTSAVGTDSQQVCKNEAIIPITYSFSGGNTPVAPVIAGLPNGITGTESSPGEFTISGSSSVEGFYTYTLTTQGNCVAPSSLTGSITVGLGLLTPGNNIQNICKGDSILPIKYSVVGGDVPTPILAGLPAGLVVSNPAAGVLLITGTPTEEGRFAYTVTTDGTCLNESSLSGVITVGLGLINAGADSQVVCKSVAITDINYALVGGDVMPTVIGLPSGVTGSISSPGVYTISGTPTTEGYYSYSVTTNGTCTQQSTLTGSIMVGMRLISGAETDSQLVCKNTLITPIVYAFAGGNNPTAPSITGLPTGVTGSVTASGEFTISGMPAAEGLYSYTLTTQGSCNMPSSMMGTIAVGLGLMTPGTNIQGICKGDPIADIVYSVVGGDAPTPIIVGLPNGVTSSITSPGVLTISGTPIAEGLYTYSVTTQGSCTIQSTLIGTLTVGIGVKTAAVDTQGVCRNNVIQNIVYSFVGGSTPAPTVIGLPTGVTSSVTATGELTISGTPTVAGVYNYIVTTAGSCSNQSSLTGQITVDYSTVAITSAIGTDSQKVCANSIITNITYAIGGTATGATVYGLLPGMVSNYTSGTLVISGSPDTVAGVYTLTVSPSGACAQAAAVTFVITIVKPQAIFTNDIDSGNPPLLVTFTNNSTDANTYLWNFGDGASDTLLKTIHKYTALGKQTVQLIASFNNQCADTATTAITIYKFEIPNIFTPNGDNTNDFFIINGIGLLSLDVEIYNRWGIKMAEWQSLGGSWDGHNMNTGDACPEGTYYYKIKSTDIDGGTYSESGAILLMR